MDEVPRNVWRNLIFAWSISDCRSQGGAIENTDIGCASTRAFRQQIETEIRCRMFPHFPLEQMCSHSEEHFQLAFARSAMGIVRDQPDCKLQPTGKGLLILGETEDAMSRPVRILQSAYGARLAVGALTIRYRSGPVVEEPHMGVRVSCPAAPESRCGSVTTRLFLRRRLEAPRLDRCGMTVR
jgi:hypothetical protein